MAYQFIQWDSSDSAPIAPGTAADEDGAGAPENSESLVVSRTALFFSIFIGVTTEWITYPPEMLWLANG